MIERQPELSRIIASFEILGDVHQGGEMFVFMNWRAETSAVRRTFRLHNRYGEGKGWLVVESGKGALCLNFSPHCDDFTEPRRYSALGFLPVVATQLPALDGDYARLRVSAIPKEWVEASDSVLSLFQRLGFQPSLDGRALSLGQNEHPATLINKVGATFFALDSFTRQIAPLSLFDRARDVAVQEFGEVSDELLALLDGERGSYRLSEVLGRRNEPNRADWLQNDIRATLRRLSTRRLVQFDCGNGRFLHSLWKSLELETVIGIEASHARLERAKKRLEGIGPVHHGSVTEFSEELPEDATGLLVDSLPLVSDRRLSDVETVIFQRLGFQWVLCVEGESWDASELKGWAARISDKYGYGERSWNIGRTHTAVLFRRRERHAKKVALSPRQDRRITTRLYSSIYIAAHQWASSLEAFSRHTVDPRWLIYLPPGMTSRQEERADGYLEHPEDAFNYYRGERIPKVVVELKHMGSRAIAIVCQDGKASRDRFGTAEQGCIYTRNGRPFLDDDWELLGSLREGLSRAGFWKRFQTTWVCLDGELLPWTLKADRLLEERHGEILASGEAVFRETFDVVKRIAAGDEHAIEKRLHCFRNYRLLYEKYQAESKNEVHFAPFHLIGSEGRTFFDKNHVWHMTTLGGLARRAGAPFIETPHLVVPLADENVRQRAVSWWEEISGAGGEGVVIKPLSFISTGRRGLAQPGLKCRGKEHLRLVYGPDYDLTENRVRLLDRDARSNRRNKHRRVLRQFALAIEAVERFTRREPLERIQECVRGLISLETRAG